MAVKRGMPEIQKMTGHECPKNARNFCWNVLGLRWNERMPAVDEDVFKERMEAYNNGTLPKLLKKLGVKLE